MSRRLAYVLLYVSLLFCTVESTIYKLSREQIGTNQISEYQVGIFSREDSPFKKNDPTVSVDLSFSQNLSPKEAMNLQAILFQSDITQYIGKKIDNKQELCCWTPYFEAGECDKLGELIIQPEAYQSENQFYFWQVGWEFQKDNNRTLRGVNLQIGSTFSVKKSGVWEFAMVHCGMNESISDEEQDQVIIVSGSITFLNSYGHLPGDILGLMPVYLFCFLGFLAAIIWWAIVAVKYREELLFLQKCIGVVIISGIFENLLFFLDYVVYNSTGEISLTFNVLSVFALVFKRTACFVCLLMIASGYTISMPKMTKKFKTTLVIFGICYAVACWLYEFVRMLRYTPATQYLKVSSAGEYLLLAILSMLDFGVLLWIFFSLFRTMSQLSREKQIEKFQHFKKLTIVLGLAYLASLIFFGIQAYASWTSKYTKWWKGWWVWDGYWSMLYLFLIIIIAFLWRPSGNNKRFTYTAFDNDEVELPETGEDDIKLKFQIQDEEEEDLQEEDNESK